MILTESIVYNGPWGVFEGTISWDDTNATAMPGVLVSHAFGGQSAFETQIAEKLAGLGYVGFAIDVYGQVRRASSPEEAYTLMAELNDNRPLLLERMRAAVTTLGALPQVDTTRIGAIGFCFGGKCVLDLARSGDELRCVVCFHGIYDPPPDQVLHTIQAAVLIFHGWDDPLSNPQQTVALADELTRSEADWQIHAFGKTGHAFTNPKAQAPEDGMLFNRVNSDRAWKHMEIFLAEALTS